jgi:hypothetical protein
MTLLLFQLLGALAGDLVDDGGRQDLLLGLQTK